VIIECPCEADVVAAVLGRQWETVDGELKMHAAQCEICREVVAVSGLLSSDHEQTRRDVHLPVAGQVWWRSAVRARAEAAHTAARPLTWLHGIAGACAVGLAWAAAGMAWPFIRFAASWVSTQAWGVDSRIVDVAVLVTAVVQKSLPFAFVAAACLVLAPVALYFALSDD
jgi:hypothetical protein